MTRLQQIQSAVKAQAETHKLNLAEAGDYNRAFAEARRQHPVLFAANEGAVSGAQASTDGQNLTPKGWPVPAERLLKLGLPVQTSQEAFRVFSLAEETKLTGELAAVVVRSLVQFSQLERSLSFDEAMLHVAKYRPELYKLALEVARNKPPR